jgi:EAL domain-containing protein (putative c-di-GMP-specific phosphodiesterase class I)
MGHSGLGYLQHFEVDKIKIDRSFVRDLTQDDEAAAIVQAIVTLAHAMHLDVTAEGVETEAQQDFLSRAGCSELQGYLFSKPLPEAEIKKMLTASLGIPYRP